jgi:hypothetical protein
MSVPEDQPFANKTTRDGPLALRGFHGESAMPGAGFREQLSVGAEPGGQTLPWGPRRQIARRSSSKPGQAWPQQPADFSASRPKIRLPSILKARTGLTCRFPSFRDRRLQVV